MLLAAKEKMLSPLVPWCAETCISAHESEGKKPHQGVAAKKSAHFLEHELSNSTTALGLRGQAALNRIGSRCTGKKRDLETGLDYFGARYYSNGLGRFMTPDWAAKATAVPYADFADPQSLNLYGYVRNLPTVRFDPDGHQQHDNKETLQEIESLVDHTQQWPPTTVSPLEQKIANVLSGNGWKTDKQVAADRATREAKVRTDWHKEHPNLPYHEIPVAIGMVVPTGGSASLSKAALADEAVVVRGGLNQAENFVKGTGVTVDEAGKLQGVSVNSANGASVAELSKGIKNGQVGVTTVGDVKAAGGTVTPTPTVSNPNHCTMCGITPEKAEKLFTPTIPNPSKP